MRLVAHKVFTPTPGDPIDFEATIEATLREWHARFRIRQIVSEQFSELIGCPISKSLTTCCVSLELRSLPSTGITRLPRYCEPLRHPKAPGLSLAGIRLVIAAHAMGLPVLRTLSLCTCRRHYPGAASERIVSLISSRRISLPRKGCRVDLRIVLFEACSAFTRVAACTLALSPIRDTLIEGFSHFVTSMTALMLPAGAVAGWDLHPLEKRRLVTAHTHLRHLAGSKSEVTSAIAQRPVRVASIEACDAASVLDRCDRHVGRNRPGNAARRLCDRTRTVGTAPSTFEMSPDHGTNRQVEQGRPDQAADAGVEGRGEGAIRHQLRVGCGESARNPAHGASNRRRP